MCMGKYTFMFVCMSACVYSPVCVPTPNLLCVSVRVCVYTARELLGSAEGGGRLKMNVFCAWGL